MDERREGRSNVVFGIVFLVLAVLTLFLTMQIEGPRRDDVSIKTFPAFIGVGMLLLAPLLITKGLRILGSTSQRRAVDRPQASTDNRFPLRFVLFVVFGFLYTQVVRPVGYVVATPLLVFSVMLLYGDRKWYRLVIVPIVVTFILYHLFRTFFRVPLPTFGLW